MSETDPFRDAIDGLVEHVRASSDVRRSDRLWPTDPITFQTNPLNLGYGACGTAIFLHDVAELPPDARDLLVAQPVTVAAYPPGLYSGIAGVGWSHVEMGIEDRGLELFRLVLHSPLAFQATDVFNGCAGWGMAALALHLRTGQQELADMATRAGDYLLDSAQHDEHGTFWPERTTGLVPLGFAYGSSGVAIFLLYLSRVTGDDRYLAAARSALEFDIAHGQSRGDELRWGTTTDSEGSRPYWLRGGAGVAAALIRFASVLHEPRYLELARRAVRPCGVFFSAAPHLFEGLAAMGEALLDMFILTGEDSYLAAARQKAEQTLLYRIARPIGTAFPGRYMFRISHDYGCGGAGIGLFLHRLTTMQPRRFHDISPALGVRPFTLE